MAIHPAVPDGPAIKQTRRRRVSDEIFARECAAFVCREGALECRRHLCSGVVMKSFRQEEKSRDIPRSDGSKVSKGQTSFCLILLVVTPYCPITRAIHPPTHPPAALLPAGIHRSIHHRRDRAAASTPPPPRHYGTASTAPPLPRFRKSSNRTARTWCVVNIMTVMTLTLTPSPPYMAARESLPRSTK